MNLKEIYNTIILFFILLFLINTCVFEEKKDNSKKKLTKWEKVKYKSTVEVKVEGFGTPYRQPLSTEGWEDGIYISPDGLKLYCTYAPGDVLSWTIYGGSNSTAFFPFRRGPDFGMDLVTNPVGASSWLHFDILYAERNSLTTQFTQWNLSKMSEPVFSEGAVVIFEGITYYTYNNTANYSTDIFQASGSPENALLPGVSMKNFTNLSAATEDNLCIKRIDDSTIILFFDSNNYPGGRGSHDIWYSISTDNGDSWSTPTNNLSINTSSQEHQPFLYHDLSDSKYYLYYSANYEGKLGIFRTAQITTGNWIDWSTSEIIITGTGNITGIGEPTLTEHGDISFVVVYELDKGTIYNKYDADPWFLPKN